MIKEIRFTGKQKLEINTSEKVQILAPNEIRVRAVCSLMSTGTENIVYNQIYDKGSHWDRFATFPFRPGYSMIGDVTEIGSKVTTRAVGDRVALRLGHKSEHIVNAADSIPVPKTIDPEHAAWFGLAKITYVGAKAANYTLGHRVLIIGAGPIGQMSIRWAKAAGAKTIVVVDPEQNRLSQAKQGGAHFCIAQPLAQAGAAILKCFDNVEPDVVMDTTGVASVFQEALKFCKPHGKVVIMGDTGSPTSQNLSSDVMSKGLNIVAAHDSHIKTQEPFEVFFAMLEDGRMDVSTLNTHYFNLDDGQKAYETVNKERGKTMGVVFTYEELAYAK